MKLNDIFLTESQLLTELDWYDKSPTPDILRRFPGKWVHFTRGARGRDGKTTVPKIGINPANGLTPDAREERGIWSSHHDPMGVYFYPVDFVFSNNNTNVGNRMRSGTQYGFNMPYYYVADLDLSANGIDLGKVTWEQVEDIADRNGWAEFIAEFYRMRPEDRKRKFYNDEKNLQHPGWFLWNFVDRLVKDEKIRWNQAFKGIDYILDPNLGIIHSNEPHQIVVFNPRIIKVLASGENKPYEENNADAPGHWDHAIKKLFKMIRGEFGGDLLWKQKKPTLTFVVGKATFTCKMRDTRGYPVIDIDFRLGRSVGHFSVSSEELRNLSFAQIMDKIKAKVSSISRRKTDLLFTPIFTESVIKDLLRRAVIAPLKFQTEIRNDSGVEYNDITVIGDYEKEIEGVQVGIRTWLTATNRAFRLHASIRLMGKNFLQISPPGYEGSPPEDVDVMMDMLTSEFKDALHYRVERLRPKSDRGWQQFENDEDADAFIGWLIKTTGLSFGGRVEKAFSSSISAYETHSHKDYLLSHIRYLFR